MGLGENVAVEPGNEHLLHIKCGHVTQQQRNNEDHLNDITKLTSHQHQLFENHPGLKCKPNRVVLIEDSLFFGDAENFVKFHKQKLWLHRATMKRYQARLEEQGFKTVYIEYCSDPQALQAQLASLRKGKKNAQDPMMVVEPDDYLLNRRLQRFSDDAGIELKYLPNPMFLNGSGENAEYRAGKKRWFMADFYKWQRKRLNVLMEGDQPVGGKWSFDADNRKKIPKKTLDQIPRLPMASHDEIDKQAQAYVERHFPDNPGSLQALIYPTCSTAAEAWLDEFLRQRLERFGDFEDAIVEGESWLWHSVLTPMLNTGLLTPQQVLQQTLKYANMPSRSLKT